jgi:TetR/AcrR family tetracycline transcriptional repressor
LSTVRIGLVRKRRPDARPRPRIDLDLVIQAAIAVLDEDGLEGLTTRRLAARLGIQSAALYWYVRDKDELLDLVADAICAPALEPIMSAVHDSDLDLRERWMAAMRGYRAVLRSHRAAPRLLAERPPVGPIRRRLGDAAVGSLLDAGFPERDAATIALIFSDYLISVVNEELRFETRPSDTDSDARRDSDAYPNLERVAPFLATADPDALFEFAMGLLLDGVERRLAQVGAWGRRAGTGRRQRSAVQK